MTVARPTPGARRRALPGGAASKIRPVALADRPVQQPLADTAAHPALRRRLPVLVREPLRVGEQPGEGGPDRLAGLRGRAGAPDRLADAVHEGAYDRGVEHKLVRGHREA